ncbi:serine/threonine protein phosphatase [Sphingomonas sp. A2-49]|uniref:metallophosphoesterase family protein n=1 Tax=Sphingomonas sp. A2-49 TaxID=1391375 RepID=UPI0021CE8227|nr:metallophosphoesterase family protein [Sphingomonas sp. A2-49]MCU6455095.1 serine/threonine protein phosphatase [Sphingomonas sp. A2-49]
MTRDAAVAAPRARAAWAPDHAPSARAASTEGRVIYAIGDIHGCYAQLAALLEAIVADVGRAGEERAVSLVFCGDYVDRGPESAKVLAALVWLARHATIDVVFLRGNHEAMLLEFLEHPDLAQPWLEQDGVRTLASYGVVSAPDEDRSRLRDRLLDAMPAAHLEFLRGLPIRTTCGDYLFVHAGLKPGVALARQDDQDCLWIGEEFLAADHRFEKVVVHGHSWTSEAPQVTDNRIGIDTGAYATGVLTAVRLDGERIAFLQSRLYPGRETEPATQRLHGGPGDL